HRPSFPTRRSSDLRRGSPSYGKRRVVLDVPAGRPPPPRSRSSPYFQMSPRLYQRFTRPPLGLGSTLIGSGQCFGGLTGYFVMLVGSMCRTRAASASVISSSAFPLRSISVRHAWLALYSAYQASQVLVFQYMVFPTVFSGRG